MTENCVVFLLAAAQSGTQHPQRDLFEMRVEDRIPLVLVVF